MAQQIVLLLREKLTEEEKQDLQYLLGDALQAFRVGRLDAWAYVKKNYKDLTEEQAYNKVEQIERRTALADKLMEPAKAYALQDVPDRICPIDLWTDLIPMTINQRIVQFCSRCNKEHP